MPARNRRAPEKFIPSPIIARPKKRKRDERPKLPEQSKLPQRPPWWPHLLEKASEFLFSNFGNGYINENRGDPLYDYWNRYARSDLTDCRTFEKACFICKADLPFALATTDLFLSAGHERRYSDELVFCGVENCPKVYHKTCLKEAADRYSFILNDEEMSCPWHHCSQCGAEHYRDIAMCPTCPYSVCANCTGFHHGICKSMCHECFQFSIDFKAPEMLMDLTQHIYK